MIVVTRAIVATGAYGTEGLSRRVARAAGRRGSDGAEDLMRVDPRSGGQGRRLDQDLRRLPRRAERRQTVPTFTQEEMKTAVETAHSIGRPVAVHATHDRGNAARDRRRRRHDRARRRRHARGVQADGRAAHRAVPDARGRPTRRASTPAGTRPAARPSRRQCSASAQSFKMALDGRRDDRERLGRRRVHARRQRARDRADGRLRHDAGRRAASPRRRWTRRVLHMDNQVGRVAAGPARGSRSRSTAIRRRTSRCCTK